MLRVLRVLRVLEAVEEDVSAALILRFLAARRLVPLTTTGFQTKRGV